MSISRGARALRLTTGFVLLEVGNALCRAVLRSRFVEFYTWLRQWYCQPTVDTWLAPVSSGTRTCQQFSASENKSF